LGRKPPAPQAQVAPTDPPRTQPLATVSSRTSNGRETVRSDVRPTLSPRTIPSYFQVPHVFVYPPEEEQVLTPPWCCFDASVDAYIDDSDDYISDSDCSAAAAHLERISRPFALESCAFHPTPSLPTDDPSRRQSVVILRALVEEAEKVEEQRRSLDALRGYRERVAEPGRRSPSPTGTLTLRKRASVVLNVFGFGRKSQEDQSPDTDPSAHFPQVQLSQTNQSLIDLRDLNPPSNSNDRRQSRLRSPSFETIFVDARAESEYQRPYSSEDVRPPADLVNFGDRKHDAFTERKIARRLSILSLRRRLSANTSDDTSSRETSSTVSTPSTPSLTRSPNQSLESVFTARSDPSLEAYSASPGLNPIPYSAPIEETMKAKFILDSLQFDSLQFRIDQFR